MYRYCFNRFLLSAFYEYLIYALDRFKEEPRFLDSFSIQTISIIFQIYYIKLSFGLKSEHSHKVIDTNIVAGVHFPY